MAGVKFTVKLWLWMTLVPPQEESVLTRRPLEGFEKLVFGSLFAGTSQHHCQICQHVCGSAHSTPQAHGGDNAEGWLR